MDVSYETKLSLLQNVKRSQSIRVSYENPKKEPILTIQLLESKKYGKDQETIQSSTTPDPGYHMEKKQEYNKHS